MYFKCTLACVLLSVLCFSLVRGKIRFSTTASRNIKDDDFHSDHEGHNCIHDKIIKYEQQRENGMFAQYKRSLLKRTITNVNSATENWGNLRVSFRTDYIGSSDIEKRTCLNGGDLYWKGSQAANNAGPSCSSDISTNCWAVCNNNDVATTDFINNIKNNVIPALKTRFFDMLQTRQVDDGSYKNKFTTCDVYSGGVPVPLDIKQTGFVGTDIVIFVTTRPTESSVLGWASYCQLDPTYGRPVMALLNLSPKMIGKSLGEQLSVGTHECLHSLGFSAGMFQFFYDSTTGTTAASSNIYFEEINQFVDATGVTRSKTILKLKTPKVLEVAKKHFGCDTLNGVAMEEGGGSGTEKSHWEKSLLLNEIMIGSITSNMATSAFSLAFMQDTGFYRANFSYAESMAWGKNMGCPFAKERCENWPKTRQGYFCADPAKQSCTYDLRSKGYCGVSLYTQNLQYYEHIPNNPKAGGFDPLMNYCPYIVPYSNGDCRSGKLYAYEYSGVNSACFESNIAPITSSQSEQDTRCFEFVCDTTNKILKIKVQGSIFSCPAEQKATTFTSGFPFTYRGYLSCPESGYDILCSTGPIVVADNNANNSTNTTPNEGEVERPHNRKGPCWLGIFFCNSGCNPIQFYFLSTIQATIGFYFLLTYVLSMF
ncbi:hypothetical protein ABK040_004365 [Willaertia magna]